MRFLSAFISIYLIGSTLQGEELQLWTQGAIHQEVSKNTEFYVFSGVRFDENGSEAFFKYMEAGLVFNLDDKWLIIPSFRESFEKILGTWEPQENPRFTLIRRWEKERVTLSNRSRFEYRSRQNFFLYRNLTFIEYKPPFSKKVIPYVGEEFFLDQFKNFTQNRLHCGMQLEMFKCLSGTLGYIFRNKKVDGNWTRNHIILGYLDFNF